jgi:hypothetical protein
MRIVLRGHDGTVLGMREVAAPPACQERAVVAAVVIVAWLGQWAHGEPPAPVTLAQAAAAPPPPAAQPRGRADVAAFAFGSHDGSALTWGVGAQAGYGLGPHLMVTGLADWSGERTRPVGPAEAAYRMLRFGVGIAARRAIGRGFLDAGIVPEAIVLFLHGEGLSTPRSPTVWELAADGRVRAGLRLAAIVPFVYAEVSYALITTQLTLDDSRDSATLSRWSFAAGVGVLIPFGPLGG